MAKLQDLQPMIENEHKTAKIFVAKDHFDNDKKRDMDIFISLDATGHYVRSLRYVEPPNYPTDQKPIPYSRWSHIFEDMPASLAESDQWEIEK